jgi:uncharacterized protein YggE
MPDPQPNGITTTGEGLASAPPDIARLNAGVSALRTKAADAREATAASLQRMIDALRTAGIAESDLQTRRMAVTPEFDYDKGKQRPRGVRATNVVSVTIRDLDNAGAIIDATLSAGGDDAVLHGIDFAIEHPDAQHDAALRAAVADARRKAETLAAATGVTLGGPLRISELDVRGGPQPRLMMAAMDTESAPTPVAPGEVDVTARVEVTWAIA